MFWRVSERVVCLIFYYFFFKYYFPVTTVTWCFEYIYVLVTYRYVISWLLTLYYIGTRQLWRWCFAGDPSARANAGCSGGIIIIIHGGRRHRRNKSKLIIIIINFFFYVYFDRFYSFRFFFFFFFFFSSYNNPQRHRVDVRLSVKRRWWKNKIYSF